MKFTVLLLICFLSIDAECRNTLQFSQISTKNGLSQNTVRDILEDKNGFIWAGTLNGLDRYDGYNLTVYRPKFGDINSINDHRIKEIHQDKGGLLWVKTYKNIFSCYDPIKDSFMNEIVSCNGKTKNKLSFPNYHEAKNGDVWLWGNTGYCLRIKRKGEKLYSQLIDLNFSIKFLYEDSFQNIWIGGTGGLFRVVGNRAFKCFKDKPTVNNAIEMNETVYFLCNGASIIKYDRKKNSYFQLKFNNREDFSSGAELNSDELLIITNKNRLFTYKANLRSLDEPKWAGGIENDNTISFIVDKNKGVWIFNHSGHMWYHNYVSRKFKEFTLIPSNITKGIDLERYNVFIDSKGMIWITTYGNGLFRYDERNDILENYKYDKYKSSPISNYLLSITEDRDGDIWVGSEYAGIIKITRTVQNIEVIRPEGEKYIGRDNNIRAIYEDGDGNIWIGSKSGNLYVYKERFKDKKLVQSGINPYVIYGYDKNIMVGTKGQGLYMLDKSTYRIIKRYRHDKKNKRSISYNDIFCILKDRDGRLWIGTFGGGLNCLVEKNGNTYFRQFFNDGTNKRYIRSIFQDDKGLIWLGTSEGIICFKGDEMIRNKDSYTAYTFNLLDNRSLSCNDVKVITEDRNKHIWVGTAGGGLNEFVRTKGRRGYFINYTTENGLSGDVISGILLDRNNCLWISTENGITKYDTGKNTFIQYDFSSNIYGNSFNENCNINSRTGDMMWGSLDGIVVFNPVSFVPRKNNVPVTLTDFSLFNQKVNAKGENSPLKESITYSDRINLNYKQNSFTIYFSTLSLPNPEKNKYSYLLENYDNHWNLSAKNEATYKNLPPGHYIFKIKGTNKDGMWNEKIKSIDIIVNPPFYRSAYAYSLYLVLLVCIILFSFNLTKKFTKLRNDVKIEKQLTDFKLRFFTNISHEFKTPLTMICAVVEKLSGQKGLSEFVAKQLKVLVKNTVLLHRLIDQLLEFRKIQSNVLTLNLEMSDIIDFAKDIFSSFNELAGQKNMEYVFKSNVPFYNMYIDKKKLDKIIYNLLSNAFKYTNDNGYVELNVSIDEAKNLCHISAKDTGIGIPKEKQNLLFGRFMQINFSYQGTGIGLSLVKEFVEALKGKVWYESNGDKGSIFHVEFPTSLNAYSSTNIVDSSVSETDYNLYGDQMEEKIKSPEINKEVLLKYSILIIDDNKDILDFLYDEFDKYMNVFTALNGEEGMDKAKDINPDIIICDVMMPGMDGFEFTKSIKDDFQTCHIPIILLTAHSSINHQLEGIESGADAYIMKPFSIKYLKARVFKLIEQRELLKKRFSNEYVVEGNLVTTMDKDKEFYNKINKILDDNVCNSDFTIDKFARSANVGRTIFYKKIKGITGLSPNELIKIRRLQKAAELLLKKELTVSEISYKVGFEDPFYFSKCFKIHYNCSPSKFGDLHSDENLKKLINDKVNRE